MAAYYNEFDPNAAAWLRELISAGLIAPGDVDERSISDVSPDDVRGYTQCHWFAGVGGWSIALRMAGWGDDRPVWTGSCPCQPFSAAGKRKGVADERHLWPEMFRLIRECRPAVTLGEQVEAAVRLGWVDGVRADLEGEGYAFGFHVLGAHSVGAPHIRQRIFWVAESTSARFTRAGQGASPDGFWKDSVPQRAVAQSQFAGDGTTCGLPDAGCGRREVAYQHRIRCNATTGEREADQPRVRGKCRRLQHSASNGRDEGRAEPIGGSAARGCQFCGYEFDVDSLGKYGCPNCCGDGLGDTEFSRLEGHSRDGDDGYQPGWIDSESTGSVTETSCVNHWRDFILVPCGDGKERRLKPGLEPLAHGLHGRASLLRGYGNAIVPEVAAEFIKAYLDC